MNEEKHLLLPMDLQFLQMSQILMSQTLTIQTNRGFIDKGFSKSKNENPDGKETGKTFTRDDVAKMVAAETKSCGASKIRLGKAKILRANDCGRTC